MKVCTLQGGVCSTDSALNNDKIATYMKQAVSQYQPDLIVCSELMNIPYFAAVSPVNDAFFTYAEPMDGPTVQKFITLSAQYNVHLVGTYFERETIREQTNYYNTAFICSPTRGLIGQYRKVHLPYVSDASMETNEKYYFEQFGGGGHSFPTFTLDNGVRLGILICFDRGFPEAWRSLALQNVDLIAVPTATYGFRKSLFVAELQVRALENNIFVAGVNKAGIEQLPGEPLERNNFGLSCLINPLGEIIAQAGEDEWAILCADLDFTDIERSKKRVDWKNERKLDAYIVPQATHL